MTGSISIEVAPLEIEEEIYLPFPPDLAKLLEYQDGDHLLIILEDGKMTLHNKRLIESTLCPICSKSKKRYECIACHRMICPNCYWKLGGLCKECMDKGPKIG